jgi:LuxR family transcriptional regulator
MVSLQNLRAQIDTIANAGYYLALRVGFSFPQAELNALPDDWVEYYTTHGLVVSDPVLRWAYSNSGAARLSELDMPDPQKVLARALNHGLGYGAVVSVIGPADQGRRSYGFFFRADRELSLSEIAALEEIVQAAHYGQDDNGRLTVAELEVLQMQAQGLRVKRVAAQLGISESAVKARLNNAKRKLGAKTMQQALSIVAARRLI